MKTGNFLKQPGWETTDNTDSIEREEKSYEKMQLEKAVCGSSPGSRDMWLRKPVKNGMSGRVFYGKRIKSAGILIKQHQFPADFFMKLVKQS